MLKNISKKLIILIFVIFILSIFNSYRTNEQLSNFNFEEKIKLESSEIHEPILINNDQELNEFCSGNGTDGTKENPHIIQNYEISTTQNGIQILNTTLYLIIRNCSISSDEVGILLNNCTNIIIENCNINANIGISLNYSTQINILFNNISRTIIYGLEISNSNNLTILNNIFTENNATSIYFNSSFSIDFKNNIVFNNNPQEFPYSQLNLENVSNLMILENMIIQNQGNATLFGNNNKNIQIIFNNISQNSGSAIFQNESINIENVTVKYNNIIGNEYGIYWINGSSTKNNTFSYNNISNNSVNGLVVHGNENNILGNNITFNGVNGIELNGYYINCIGNNISYNNEIGIIVDSDNSTKIWLNYISNNSFSNGLDINGIIWDNGSIGNYWGDYSNLYPNASNNGITWNELYLINQTLGEDRFPLVNPDSSPKLNEPQDIHYETNTTGHYINWTIDDFGYYDSSYIIYMNETIISIGIWNNLDEIILNVDGLEPNIIYCYKILVHDGTAWNFSIDEVIVTVNTFPIITNISIIPSTPYTNDSLTVNYTYYDADGDPENISIIKWYKNNEYQPQFDNWLNIPAIWTNKSDIWNLSIQPYDGKDYGNIYWSNSVTIKNSPPTISQLSLGPDTILTTQNITISYTFEDLDGDSDQSRIIWYKGGIEQPQFENQSVLSSVWTNKSDVWYVEIYPYDGFNFNYPIMSYYVYIENSIPIIIILDFIPSNPKTNDVLNITYSFLDDDNDIDNSIIKWYKNDQHYSENDNKTFLLPNATSFGDKWCVEIIPYDRESFGTPKISKILTIEYTPPQIVYLTLSQEVYEVDNITCSYQFIDDDGHSEVYSLIRWYCNGQQITQLDNKLIVPSNLLHSGDKWRVAIRTFDGYDFSDLVISNEVEVLENSIPIFQFKQNNSEFIKGSKNAIIKWIVHDENIRNASYIVKINGIVNVVGTWNSDNEIVINMTSYDIGRYKIELFLTDGLGASLNDTIYVNIITPKKEFNIIFILILVNIFIVIIGIILKYNDEKKLDKRINEIIENQNLIKKEQQIKEILNESEEYFKHLNENSNKI